MNQTRLLATAPTDHARPPGPSVTAAVIVDSGQLQTASFDAWRDLTVLVGSVIRKKGGDVQAIEWSAEPVGPQVRLVALNGARL